MNFFRSIYFFIIVGLVSASMAGLITLLVLEYRFFVRELDELTQLKQEYDNYLLLFKRKILQEENQDIDKDDLPDGLEKKKTNDLLDEPFLLVNRDQSYLQNGALDLGKKHNIEDAVVRMYTQEPAFVQSPSKKNNIFSKKSRSVKKKRGKKSLRQLTLTREFGTEAQDIAHEMTFAWPMEKKSFWLSYGFGPRKHPSGTWEYHRGIDLAAPQGTPIYAAAAGVVIQAGYAGGYGNMVIIAHNKKFATRYAHLSKILVACGDELAQGDILGKVGATGNVRGKNGSHLHFEVMVYGKRVNPFYFLS